MPESDEPIRLLEDEEGGVFVVADEDGEMLLEVAEGDEVSLEVVDHGTDIVTEIQTVVQAGVEEPSEIFVGVEEEEAVSVELVTSDIPGPPGKTAYELAVEGGFIGTEAEWVASLEGDPGPQGIQGETGPVGPQGPPGGHYVHDQLTPSDTWVITHGLGMRPNVVVQDSAGTTVFGGIIYDTNDQLTLTFSAAFAGRAHLS